MKKNIIKYLLVLLILVSCGGALTKYNIQVKKAGQIYSGNSVYMVAPSGDFGKNLFGFGGSCYKERQVDALINNMTTIIKENFNKALIEPDNISLQDAFKNARKTKIDYVIMTEFKDRNYKFLCNGDQTGFYANIRVYNTKTKELVNEQKLMPALGCLGTKETKTTLSIGDTKFSSSKEKNIGSLSSCFYSTLNKWVNNLKQK